MKKIISFLFIAVCAAGFVACNDDDTEGAVLTVIGADVQFPAAGGEGSIRVSSPGTVTAVSDKDWLVIAGQSQSEITFTVSPSGEMMNRTATVTISYGGVSQSVAVTQLGEIFSATDLDGYEFSSKAETYMLEFYTNSDDIAVSADKDWITVDYMRGQLIITLQVNANPEPRSAIITISGGWKQEEITVTQKGFELFDENLAITLPYSGQRNYVLELSDDIELFPSDWTITVDNWVTAVKSEDGKSITFSADANTTGSNRSSKIMITGGEFVVESDIIQASVPITDYLEQYEWYFDFSQATGIYIDYRDQLKTEVAGIGEVFSELSFFPYPSAFGTHAMYFEFEDGPDDYYVMYTYYINTTPGDEFMTYLEYGYGVAGYGNYYRPLLPTMDEIVTLGINGIFMISEADNYTDPSVLRLVDAADDSNSFVMTTETVRYP